MTVYLFFFQAEDGIRDKLVTGVQTCALPISPRARARAGDGGVLLEQGQEKRSLGGELAVDGALREARGVGHLIEAAELDGALSKHTQSRLEEEHPGLTLPPPADDTHGGQRYWCESQPGNPGAPPPVRRPT